MATIHPQRPAEPLPSGWESRLDPRTGRYYYINHAEHTTTWEDPRMRHPQVQQQEGSTVIQVDERLLMKLCLQFPTVEEGHIWQFLKQYHNREHVVISALMAEGHPRAQTHPMAHEQMTPKLQKQIVEPPPPTIDEALVHKLHSYFPAVEFDCIRNLLKKFNNQEHEVIASLVSGSWKPGARPQTAPSSPKMKLRYLKLVYPEVDEAVLFDILYNCDNNAYEASNRLTSMGYKKRDTPIIRPNSNQQPKPTPEPTRPKLSDRPVVVGLPSNADKQLLMARIQEQFPAVSKTLVSMALESSNYMEERAKQFLKAMTPMDGTSKAIFDVENRPSSSEEAQDNHSKTTSLISGNNNPAITVSEEIQDLRSDKEQATVTVIDQNDVQRANGTTEDVSSDSLREQTPLHTRSSEGRPRSKLKKESAKITKATTTNNIHEDQPYISSYRTHPKGPDSSLRKGPSEDLLLKELMPWSGADPKLRRGPDSSCYKGPDPKNLSSYKESLAKGPCRDHRRGPLADITHHTIRPSNEQ